MDIKITEKYRNEIYFFVKDYVNEAELNWIMDTFSRINKQSMLKHNDEFDFKSYYFYKNFVKFFKEFVTDLDGGSIIITTYICGLQLGICKLHDESVLRFEHVGESYDIDDFLKCTMFDLNHYDARAMMLLTNFLQDEEHPVYSCGLLTMYAIEYI